MTLPEAPKFSLRIAIPFNGKRIMPRFGLAREFFLVEIDTEKHLSALRPCRWEPRTEPSVGLWLRGLGADGVVCDGIHPRFQTVLEAEGLWVIQGAWGEIDEVLGRLLAGTLSVPPEKSPGYRAPCCSPQSIKACGKTTCPNPERRRKNPMKIAITAQTPSPESPVDPRFGRAPWLMIYDPQNGSWESIDNIAGIEAAHGAGIQAAKKVVDHKALALVTGAIGPKAFKSLTSAGVKIYHGACGTVREALQACQQGKLAETTRNDATGRV